MEFGMQIAVSSEELHYLGDNKDQAMIYKQKAVAFEISQKMIDACGSKETFPTANGEVTIYRIFGIKHFNTK